MIPKQQLSWYETLHTLSLSAHVWCFRCLLQRCSPARSPRRRPGSSQSGAWWRSGPPRQQTGRRKSFSGAGGRPSGPEPSHPDPWSQQKRGRAALSVMWCSKSESCMVYTQQQQLKLMQHRKSCNLSSLGDSATLWSPMILIMTYLQCYYMCMLTYFFILFHQEVVGTEFQNNQTSEELQRLFALIGFSGLGEVHRDPGGRAGSSSRPGRTGPCRAALCAPGRRDGGAQSAAAGQARAPRRRRGSGSEHQAGIRRLSAGEKSAAGRLGRLPFQQGEAVQNKVEEEEEEEEVTPSWQRHLERVTASFRPQHDDQFMFTTLEK